MRLILAIVLFGLFSCSQEDEKEVAPNSELSVEGKDSLSEHQKYQNELSDWYDTNLVGGYYLKHILDDSSWVHLYWGGPDFERVEVRGSYPDYHFYFEVDFPNFIGMKGFCGSPCWGLTLLPKNAKDSLVHYDYPLSYQPNKNRMLYKPFYFKPELAVINIESEEIQVFTIDEMSEGMDFMSLYDSSFFVGDSLYIHWTSSIGLKGDDAKRVHVVFVSV